MNEFLNKIGAEIVSAIKNAKDKRGVLLEDDGEYKENDGNNSMRISNTPNQAIDDPYEENIARHWGEMVAKKNKYGFHSDLMSFKYNKATKKYEINSTQDYKDWQPTIVTFKKIPECPMDVTIGTYTFLDRLMTSLKDAEDKNEVKGVEIHAKKIDTKDLREKYEGEIRQMLEGLDIDVLNKTRMINSMLSHLTNINDNRLFPETYAMTIDIPIKPYSEDQIKEIAKRMNLNSLSDSAIEKLRFEINNDKIHIEFTITRNSIFVPMYVANPGKLNTSARADSVKKLLWVNSLVNDYKNHSDLFRNVVDGDIDTALKEMKADATFKARLKDIENSNIFKIRGMTVKQQGMGSPGRNKDDKTTFSIFDVFKKVADLIEWKPDKEKFIISITCDCGKSYVFFSDFRDSINGFDMWELNSRPDGKTDDTLEKMYNLMKKYLEGIITSDEILETLISDRTNMDADKFNTWLQCFDRITNKEYDVYSFKLMFSDDVDVTFTSPLPNGNKFFDVPAGMEVPINDGTSAIGAKDIQPTHQKTVIKKQPKLDGSSRGMSTNIITKIENLLNYTSGSMSFMDDMYKKSKKGFEWSSIREQLTDFVTILQYMKFAMSELYYVVPRSAYERIRNGETVVAADGVGLNKDGMEKIIENSPNTLPFNLLPRMNGYTRVRGINDISFLDDLLHQMNTQFSKIKNLNPDDYPEDDVTGVNIILGGRPGLINKMYENIVSTVSASEHQSTIENDAVIKTRLNSDIFSMVEAFFESERADKKDLMADVKSDKKRVVPMWGSSEYTPLKMYNTGRNTKSVDRNVIVQTIMDAFNYDKTKRAFNYEISLKTIVSKISKMNYEDRSIKQNEFMKNSITYMTNIIQAINRLMAIDGINKYNLTDSDVNAILGISSSSKKGKFRYVTGMSQRTMKYTPPENKDFKKSVESAIATATQSDIKSGIIIDEYSKKHFRPLVNMIKKNLRANLMEMRRKYNEQDMYVDPLLFTTSSSEFPNSPVYSIVTSTYENNSLVFNIATVVGSGLFTDPNDPSRIKYRYDKMSKRFYPIGDVFDNSYGDMIRSDIAKTDYASLAIKSMSDSVLVDAIHSIVQLYHDRSVNGTEKILSYFNNGKGNTMDISFNENGSVSIDIDDIINDSIIANSLTSIYLFAVARFIIDKQ